MPSITADLSELLGRIQRPGDFSTGGVCEIFPPGLEVDGVGPIALPLLPVQAEQLIAVAERAPFGRGGQTLIDIDVRRAWQINASQVKIQGRTWTKTLASIVARVSAGLGVTEPIEAELYKLLVYDEGGFFVGHRDTEKAAGMFATLVIVLPSVFSGGELVVRHQDREARFDLQCSDPSEATFAAFYADCLHEVSPVTSGRRLTLIYNLLRRERGETPRPPSHEAEREQLSALLRQWAEAQPDDEDEREDEDEDGFDDEDECDDEDGPEDRVGSRKDRLKKLIYLLEHAYTPASLSFEALKGADAARTATLSAAAQAAECDLHLALLSIEESGSAEHTGAYRSYRRSRYGDEDEFEVGEVFDRAQTLSNWRRPDGGDPGLGILPFSSWQVSPPDALEDMSPAAINFMEATGNEGASFERSYHRAALVLWPSRTRLAVVNQAGLPTTLPYLADLAERWMISGEDESSPLWTQAHELSGHMLATWPMGRWRPDLSQNDASTFLAILSRLGDTARIDNFLANVSACGALGRADSAGLLLAIRLLPRRRQVELFTRVIAGNANGALDAGADLLARAAQAAISGQLDLEPADLMPAAAALLAALPGDPARAPQTGPWGRPRSMQPDIVVDVLTALDQIDPEMADTAAEIMLVWPKTYGVDAVLVPAILKLGQSMDAELPTPVRLRTACLAHLRTRIALPLTPPSDWTRASAVTCACNHCRELGSFLADPTRETWNFKAPQADRSHLETMIRHDGHDLDFMTLRRGSPHCLVCSKNQASYERRARQRKKDMEDVAQLEASPTKKQG
jgi:predicted 2-oxoglutarate/Fe(II)-dependent dioxygenase YbiX